MKSCWNTSPGQRPSFKELKQRIHEVNMEFEGGADVTDSDSEGQQVNLKRCFVELRK